MYIQITESIALCDSTSLNLIPENYYRINCVKYPFHKDDVGYKGCCPMVGHVEHDIAYRSGHCSINLLNSREFHRLNPIGVRLAIKKAAEKYETGYVCFVANGLDSIAPIMCALFMYYCNLWYGVDMDFNKLMLYMADKVPVFKPKDGQLALGVKLFEEIKQKDNLWK